MSNNNDNSGMAIGFAFVMTGVVMMAAFVFAVLSFIAIILTVFAFLAWNNPLKLGSITIEPREARIFVYRGVVGAGLVPMFIGFGGALFQWNIDWDLLPYFILGGYVAGSLVLEILQEEEKERKAKEHGPLPMEQLPPPAKPAPSASPQLSFKFASWDDEEEQNEPPVRL